MNKINDSRIRRARTGKIIGVIVGAVFLLLAAFFFYLMHDEHKSRTFTSIPFAEAYNKDKLGDDLYVYIDVDREPYEIGHYDKDEQYYYVSDGYDLYIIRCSEKEYETIRDEVEKNGVYEITGTVYELNEEVIKTAIEVYNEGEEDPEEIIDRSFFDEYFKGVALYVGAPSGSENGSMALGIICLLIGFFVFLLSALTLGRYNKTLRRLSDMEAQIISQEIESPQTIYIAKGHTYLTPRYIVSFGNCLSIIPYTDVIWAYKFVQRYYFMPVYTDIKVMTRDFKLTPICQMGLLATGKDQIVAQIFNAIQYYNPQAQFGYSNELRKYFNDLKKQPVTYTNTNQNAG